MYFSSLQTALLLALAVHSGVNAAGGLDDKKPPPPDPCTIASGTGSFYDLRSLSVIPPEEGKKPAKNAKLDSWHARGHDYKSNFTLNICAPVVEDIEDVVGVDKSHWKNVSAFYDYGGKTYSLGQQSSSLVLRGRRLVLQYTNGSPCGRDRKREAKSKDDDDDNDDDDDKGKAKGHKSALILLQCEKDPLAPQATVSFLGADPDECSYSFLINSHAACSGSEPAKQGVGPGAVFAIIGVIAILVYFLGGVFYQRNVAHARGWRQLPNYSMWAGIGNFIKDFFIIITSSCVRFLPSRRGYSPLSVSASGNGISRGRGGRAEDENRLIDQLDEEWDD